MVIKKADNGSMNTFAFEDDVKCYNECGAKWARRAESAPVACYVQSLLGKCRSYEDREQDLYRLSLNVLPDRAAMFHFPGAHVAQRCASSLYCVFDVRKPSELRDMSTAYSEVLRSSPAVGYCIDGYLRCQPSFHGRALTQAGV